MQTMVHNIILSCITLVRDSPLFAGHASHRQLLIDMVALVVTQVRFVLLLFTRWRILVTIYVHGSKVISLSTICLCN